MDQHSPQKWFSLEEKFFSEVDQELLSKLRGEVKTAETAEAILKVTGLNNRHLAEEMAKLNVSVDTLAAFRLAPLVAVAWADDRIEENERYAITKAAEQSGIEPGSADMELLNSWTTKRPHADLLDAWCDYAKALVASLSEPHRSTLKEEMTTQIREVAQAAGGFLGFGSISPSEQSTIDRIEQALS